MPASADGEHSSVRANSIAGPNRNGLPPSVPYVYGGSGVDSMPWAILAPGEPGVGSLGSDPGYDKRRASRARYDRASRGKNGDRREAQRCGKCGNMKQSQAHKAACVEPLQEAVRKAAERARWLAERGEVVLEVTAERPRRCRQCGYLVTSAGHKVSCQEAA